MLESRMVFDGAAVDTAAAVADANVPAPAAEPAHAADPAPQIADVLQALASAPAAPEHAGATIVFIDAKVGMPQAMQAALPSGAEVVVLDRASDGVLQIAEALAGRHDVAAIHIVSHGEQGLLHLGTATLNTESMQGRYAAALATIGQALSADGDILVYGCDFTRGAGGQHAAEVLAAITGADVAGSNDDTGSASLGGNWTLETHIGQIDARAIDAPEWNGLLAPMVISASSAPVTTGGSGLGASGLWQDAGTIGGTSIDIKATVTSSTSGASTVFAISGNDLWLQITSGTVTVRWEVFASGTNQTIRAVGDPNFRIADIDGIDNNNSAFPTIEIEAVSPSLYGLTGYTLDTPTNLEAGVIGSNLLVRGTRNQNSESTSLVAFDWTNVSAWDVTYTAVSGQGTRFFYHDGDGQFTFVNPNTNYLLGIDLDANNSTATGTAYRATFTEHGAAIAVVDADATITQHAVLGTDLGSASVVLTNAQAGDALLVGGSSASSGTINGLNYTMTSSGGQISIEFSGTASVATYEATLKAVTFINTIDDPSVTNRIIDVSVTNDNFITTSNVAAATILVNRAPDLPTPTAGPGGPYINPSDPNDLLVPSTDRVPVSIDLDSYFTDANGDPLNFAVGTLPAWVSYNATTHVLSGTPPADNVGNFSIAVTVSDGRGGSLAASVTIAPVNPGPNAVDDTTIAPNSNPIVVPFLANDTDPDGDPLTIVGTPTVSSAQGSIAFVTGTGWVFTPAFGFTGNAVITYTIQDQDGATDTATHTVTVTNAPPAPLDPPGTPYINPADPNNIIVPATDNVAVSIDLDACFTDPNGDPLSFTVGTLPAWATYNPTTHVLSGTPPIDNAGNFTIPVTVSDGRGGSLAASVTFAPVNPGPDAVADTTTTGYLTPAVVPFLANDTDPDGDPLTIVGTPTVSSAQGSIAFVTGTGWVFTPAAGFSGDAIITYTIQDQDGGTDTATHTVAVANAPPTPLDPPGTPYVNPADPHNIIVPATDNVAVSIDLDACFTDPNGDPLSFTIGTLPAWVSYNPTTHVLSGTPPIDNAGNFTIPVTVSDTRGGSVAASVTFAPVNPGPDAVADTTTTAYLTPVVVPFLANDTDPDGDPLTIVGTPTVSSAQGSIAFVTGTGWVFTPAAGFSGDAIIAYTIQDQDGATDTATHTVTVANAPPTPLDPPGTPYVNPADPHNIIVPATDNVAVSIDLGACFTDPNGDPLSFTVGTLPAWATYNPTTHVLSGTPPIDNAGNFTIPVTVTDGRGGSLAASVTIAPVNPGPDAVADTTTTGYLTPVVVPFLANDTDPDGDPLTIVGTPTVSSAQGSIAFVTGTGWVFTPAAGFSGNAVITYTIQDQDGATDTATHTVTVTNAPPAPLDPPGTPYVNPADPNNIIVPATDNVAVSIDLDACFTDPNGDPLTFFVGTLPAWATYNPTTHVLSGTPPIDNAGNFTIPVTVSDTRGGSLVASLTIAPINPAPDAHDDSTSTAYGKAVAVDLLANDSDPDGDPITVVAASVPASQGSVAFNGTSWIFTPARGFEGTATISYTIRDQDGSTSSATHAVVVAKEEPFAPQPTPQPPGLPPSPEPPREPIHIEGMVIETVQKVGSLDGISGRIGTSGIVIETVNGAGSLGGIGGAINAETTVAAATVSRPVQGVDPVGPVGASVAGELHGLTGFSLRMDLANPANAGRSDPQVIIETLVREETLIIQLSSSKTSGANAIVDYKVMSADGSPMPSWLDPVHKDLIVGRRPADIEELLLRVMVVYADGRSETRGIHIETVSGEIKSLAREPKVSEPAGSQSDGTRAAAQG